ncbi:MAG: hypothetical protein FWE03_04580 [Firmicutes bacterium]|nr:hypothetical protein [Bacillota bacterium]
MRRRFSFTVAICATLVALTFVFGLLPVIFLLPILIAATCFDWKISLFAGVFFGLVSLLLSFMFAASPVAIYFITFPWLPIVARLPIPIIAHFIYRLFKKIVPQENIARKTAPIVLAAVFGTIANTFFVGLGILLLPAPYLPNEWEDITLAFLLLWGGIETGVNAILLPAIVLTLRKAVPRIFAEADLKITDEEQNQEVIV